MPFLAVLAFLNGQKWLENENFEKMKKYPPDIYLDYRIAQKKQNFDQRLSLKRDPKFQFETTKNQQNGPPGGRGGVAEIFFRLKHAKSYQNVLYAI